MNKRGKRASRPLRAGLWVVVALAACGELPDEMEIPLQRPLSSDALSVKAEATTAERFTGPQDDHAGHDHAPGEHGKSSSSDLASTVDSIFAWDLPEGWVALPATQERWINLQPAGDPNAACTLSIMPGEAGGLVENVNRWRKQMGLAPQTPAEIALLPNKLFLGQPATFVDIAGHYTGMGDQDAPDSALLGLIQTFSAMNPDGSVQTFTAFVKFTGSKELIEAEREHFELFFTSLRGATDDASGEDQASDELTYHLPEGWTDVGPSGMRIVNLAVEDAAELSVIRLQFDGGGALDNVNRWRQQLNLAPWTVQQVEGMDRVQCLGVQAYVFDAEGDNYQGMTGDGIGQARMLGVLAIGPAESYFIKFVGPKDVITREAAAFRALVDSFEVGS
jgi:hypothetical protein